MLLHRLVVENFVHLFHSLLTWQGDPHLLPTTICWLWPGATMIYIFFFTQCTTIATRWKQYDVTAFTLQRKLKYTAAICTNVRSTELRQLKIIKYLPLLVFMSTLSDLWLCLCLGWSSLDLMESASPVRLWVVLFKECLQQSLWISRNRNWLQCIYKVYTSEGNNNTIQIRTFLPISELLVYNLRRFWYYRLCVAATPPFHMGGVGEDTYLLRYSTNSRCT